MSELGDVAKGAMGALEKAKAFDKKTNNIIRFSSYGPSRGQDKGAHHEKKIKKENDHFQTLIPNYKNDSRATKKNYENYAQNHLHYSPENHILHRKVVLALADSPSRKLTNIIKDADNHVEALSRLNPSQQETYLGLLPEWSKESGDLEDTARNL